METLFQVKDKTGRIIQLSEERWKHILQEHPSITNIEEIKNVLIQPLKITESKYNPEHVRYYYQYKKDTGKYLFVAVKYLNGKGFIITAYHMRNIQ